MMKSYFCRVLFIAYLLLSSCSDNTPPHKIPYQSDETYDLETIPEAQLIKDESFSVNSYGLVNNIGDVAVDDGGRIYVVDEYSKKVVVFDSSGSDIESLGGMGSDPGDFQAPTYLKAEGQNLYVYDQRLYRAHRYSLPSLELEQVTELEFTAQTLGVDSLVHTKPFTFEVMDDGNYLVGFQRVDSPQDRGLFYYRINPEGKIISDQILSFKNKQLYVDETVNPPLIIMLPYEPETLIITDSHNRIYTAFSEYFLIHVADSAGKHLESRYYPFDKHNLIRSDVIDLYTDTHRRRAIRRASLPKTWPALAAMKTDDMDRLWVATITSDLSTYRWYILEQTGEPVAFVDLPRRSEIMLIKDGSVYIKAMNSRIYSEKVYSYTLNY